MIKFVLKFIFCIFVTLFFCPNIFALEIKYSLQSPSYISEISENSFVCDYSKEECKVNFDFRPSFENLRERDFNCEINFGFETSESSKCNPNTVTIPFGTFEINTKITSKITSETFEKIIKIENENPNYENGILKVPQPKLTLQSGGEQIGNTTFLCSKDICNLNFDLRESFSELSEKLYNCEIDFGFETLESSKCNPSFVKFETGGEFEINFKIIDKKNSENFKIGSAKIIVNSGEYFDKQTQFRVIFQSPSTIPKEDFEKDLQIYECISKKDCRVNLKAEFLNPSRSTISDAKYNCFWSFEFEAEKEELTKCNPNTISLPKNENKISLVIIGSEGKMIFEKTFFVNKSQKMTEEKEKIIFIETSDFYLENGIYVCNAKNCKINFDSNAVLGEKCFWEFNQEFNGNENSCNPSEIFYSSGFYHIKFSLFGKDSYEKGFEEVYIKNIYEGDFWENLIFEDGKLVDLNEKNIENDSSVHRPVDITENSEGYILQIIPKISLQNLASGKKEFFEGILYCYSPIPCSLNFDGSESEFPKKSEISRDFGNGNISEKINPGFEKYEVGEYEIILKIKFEDFEKEEKLKLIVEKGDFKNFEKLNEFEELPKCEIKEENIKNSEENEKLKELQNSEDEFKFINFEKTEEKSQNLEDSRNSEILELEENCLKNEIEEFENEKLNYETNSEGQILQIIPKISLQNLESGKKEFYKGILYCYSPIPCSINFDGSESEFHKKSEISWNFGNGNISEKINPGFEKYEIGEYEIILKIKFGEIEKQVKTKLIVEKGDFKILKNDNFLSENSQENDSASSAEGQKVLEGFDENIKNFIKIIGVLPNNKGKDENEFIEIKNFFTEDLNLKNLEIKNKNKKFLIKDDFILKSGETYKFFMQETKITLGNSSDFVTLNYFSEEIDKIEWNFSVAEEFILTKEILYPEILNGKVLQRISLNKFLIKLENGDEKYFKLLGILEKDFLGNYSKESLVGKNVKIEFSREFLEISEDLSGMNFSMKNSTFDDSASSAEGQNTQILVNSENLENCEKDFSLCLKGQEKINFKTDEIIGILYFEDLDFGEKIISEGKALNNSLENNFLKFETYKKSQAKAKKEKLGIWGNKDLTKKANIFFKEGETGLKNLAFEEYQKFITKSFSYRTTKNKKSFYILVKSSEIQTIKLFYNGKNFEENLENEEVRIYMNSSDLRIGELPMTFVAIDKKGNLVPIKRNAKLKITEEYVKTLAENEEKAKNGNPQIGNNSLNNSSKKIYIKNNSLEKSESFFETEINFLILFLLIFVGIICLPSENGNCLKNWKRIEIMKTLENSKNEKDWEKIKI